jgi:16S rRNA (guanine527-N7)-methyltransferase
MVFREKLARRAREADLVIPSDVISGLEEYFELLRRWNRKVSLTSLPVEDHGDEALDRLLIEPLLASRYLPPHQTSVIDIGSGGGSPAIPLKLANPGIAMRMVESKVRKAAFLREAIRQLRLANTSVESARFEDLLYRQDLQETSDVVTLRAVRVGRRTLEGLQRFLRPGGKLFLFRTGSMVNESELVIPPFTVQGGHALMAQSDSRLVIFAKCRG